MTEQARPRPDARAVLFAPDAKMLRVTLFVLGFLSFVAALFVEPALGGAVERGALSRRWLFLPLGVYGFFFLAYCVDRWGLVRRRGYPAGKALFQAVFGLLFALFLLPSTMGHWQGERLRTAERLLEHADAEVRAVAVEALGFRGATEARVTEVLRMTEDRDAQVREKAFDVLAVWSGLSRTDLAGLRAWAQARSGSKGVEGTR